MKQEKDMRREKEKLQQRKRCNQGERKIFNKREKEKLQ